MTVMPDDAANAFESHDAYEQTPKGFTVSTTAIEGVVTATESKGTSAAYTVSVRVPTLQAVTVDEVGPAVREGWLETLERRLADAPVATRASVDLDAFEVSTAENTVRVTYEFTFDDPRQAATVAKTFVEYVEGTYVEGVVPGYEYESPVTDLLQTATDDGSAGTPL